MKAQIRLEIEVCDDDELVGLANAMLDVATERGVPASVGDVPDVWLMYNDLSVDLARRREAG